MYFYILFFLFLCPKRHHSNIVDEYIGFGKFFYVGKYFLTENLARIIMVFFHTFDKPIDSE